jgi:hypothetical protein
MPDEMFFSTDARSLRRGRRRAARTQICRPCLVWPADARDVELEGVALDISPYGMRVRMVETLPPGTRVKIQLMRDEHFKVPFADPVLAQIVRTSGQGDHFTDHGVKIVRETAKHEVPQAAEAPKQQPQHKHRTRMHTIDLRAGDRRRSR